MNSIHPLPKAISLSDSTGRLGEDVMRTLWATSTTFDSLNEALGTFNGNTDKLMSDDAGVDPIKKIEELRRRMVTHEQLQEEQLQRARMSIASLAKGRIQDSLMWGEMRENIRSEIKNQAKEEIGIQIREYVPLPLDEHLIESRKKLASTKISLKNSQAKAKNRSIRAQSHLDEPLAPLLKADGERSETFPADLRSLLAYNPEDLRALMDDYGLVVSGKRGDDLNTTIEYLGARYRL